MFKTANEVPGVSPVLPSVLPAGQGDDSVAVTGLELRVISDVSGFRKIEPEWNALFDRAGQANQLFQTYAWNRHWCDCFVERDDDDQAIELSILCGWRNEQLVMVWPLIRRSGQGITTVEWMGAPVSQYGDVLIEQSCDKMRWMSQGLAFLKRSLSVDAILLDNVRADSEVGIFLATLGVSPVRTQHAPYVDLKGVKSVSDFRCSYSTKTRKQRARRRRRFMEIPGAHRELLKEGERAGTVVREALVLKRRWLDNRGVVSRAFLDKRFYRFIDRVVRSQDRSAGCMISVLSADEAIAAAEIGFIVKDCYVSHLASYDIELSKLSPGVLQFEDTIQACIDQNIAVIDLLAPSDSYKFEWADGKMAVHDFVIPVTLKGRLVSIWKSEAVQIATRTIFRKLPRSLQSMLVVSSRKLLRL